MINENIVYNCRKLKWGLIFTYFTRDGIVHIKNHFQVIHSRFLTWTFFMRCFLNSILMMPTMIKVVLQDLKNWKFGCTFFRVRQYRFACMPCTQPVSCTWVTCACTRVCRLCTPPCTWLCTLSKYFPSVVLS